MVLVKKFEILPCFYFLQKTASKMRLAIFYKVTKLFLNLVHDNDCIKKNYIEQQAIPSFHGIHRVEFLSMLLILQFLRWNLSLRVKDNVTIHISHQPAIWRIFVCSHIGLFIHKIKETTSDFHVWAKERSLLNAVPKLMSITINK